MPARDDAPIGAPCWVDLSSSDPTASRSFYSELFGWTADEPVEELGGYSNFRKDGVVVAGSYNKQPGMATPDLWAVHLASDDAEKTVATAVTSGGSVLVPPMAVRDLGTMAVVTDNDGAAVGVWQPGTHRGFGIVGETGAPCWFELHTRQYDGAVEFYREVFRWDTKDMSDDPSFRYTIQVKGDQQLAGIMDATAFLPEGVPSHWSVYFGVDDADAALAAVERLGGSVVQPPMETPYGRLATAADVTGALFKLVAPNEAMPARS